jgi:orotidine-5'-phosphate decarboxylase
VPGHLPRARELMGNATFLLPGVGAQGGRVEDLAPAFAPGRAGGLVTASRSIANAHLASGSEPAAAARAEAERLRAAAWALSDGAGAPFR